MISIDISNIDSETLLEKLKENINNFSDFELSLLFKADYSQSRLIRLLLGFVFEQNGLDGIWKNRFSLMADELINNSIEYGSLPLDKNVFTIKFKKQIPNFYINIEVEDTGKGEFAKNMDQMEVLRKQRIEEGFNNYLGKRGRGLFQLITNLVDKLYFKDSPSGGLIVGIEKTIG